MIRLQKKITSLFTQYSGDPKFWLAFTALIKKTYPLQSVMIVLFDRQSILPHKSNGLLLNEFGTTSFSVFNMLTLTTFFETLSHERLYFFKEAQRHSVIKGSVFADMDFTFPIALNGQLEILISGQFKRFSLLHIFKSSFLNKKVISVLKTEISHCLSVIHQEAILGQLSEVKQALLFDCQNFYATRKTKGNEIKKHKAMITAHIQLVSDLNSSLFVIQSTLTALKQCTQSMWPDLLSKIESECLLFEHRLSQAVSREGEE